MNAQAIHTDALKPEPYKAFIVKAGGVSWGLPAERVQTVFRAAAITSIPLAPAAVAGLVNLRGRVVIAVNLAFRLFGVPAASSGEPPAPTPALAVAVERGNDIFVLLVEEAGDVVEIEATDRIVPPVQAGGDSTLMTSAWFKTIAGFVPLLDVDRILNIETDRRSGLDRRLSPANISGAS